MIGTGQAPRGRCDRPRPPSVRIVPSSPLGCTFFLGDGRHRPGAPVARGERSANRPRWRHRNDGIAIAFRPTRALSCKPLDVNHPCLMLLTFAKLLDFAQCCRGDILLVASAANNHRDVFNNQKIIAATEGLSDTPYLSGSTADRAACFICLFPPCPQRSRLLARADARRPIRHDAGTEMAEPLSRSALRGLRSTHHPTDLRESVQEVTQVRQGGYRGQTTFNPKFGS